MADVLQNVVNEINRKIVDDNGFKLAMEPKIDFPSDQAEVEKALEAKGDLNFDISLEVLPQFEVGKESLEASGIVNDHRLRASAINQVLAEAKRLGFGIHGLTKSPLPGTHGNIEYLVWFSAVETDWGIDWSGRIEELAKSKD